MEEDNNSSVLSMFSFNEVEANVASPATVREMIGTILRADGGKCYAEMEKFLMPPGVGGSRAFDQGDACTILLDHDNRQNKALSKYMASTPTFKKRQLWDQLQAVLRKAGFKMRHGRLTGLLEHKPDEAEVKNGDSGQPDID